MDKMLEVERELLEYLGFGEKDSFPADDYVNIAERYNCKELEHEHEEQLRKDHGPVYFIKNFPNYTSPFWNMKQSEDKEGIANKVDVILHGMETIGSAERSMCIKDMRHQFYTISDGNYANILFSNFTKERVENELDDFLKFNFFQRCGGGIGVTRMIRAMKLSNLI
jgi:aspartyl/asparaginyl-tRNA synthetase